MKLDETKILVVGGAIGGASTAMLLADAGAEVTLVERVAVPRAVGAAILLQPNGLAVLYGLGMREALLACATALRSGGISDRHARPIAVGRIPDFGHGIDHALVIRRSDLFTILHDRVAAHPRITTRFSTTVTEATRSGHVTLDVGRRRDTMVADLVIGADGLRSRVRETGRFGATITPGVEYFRALGGPVPITGITEYWTKLGIFGAAPLGNTTYFYGSCAAPPLATALKARDLPAIQRAWAEALPLAGDLLHSLAHFDQLLVNQVERVDCERFVDGRLVLLGDAAHAMSPNLGQGANSALVDGTVLLDALHRAPELGSALQTYDARRRPAVRKIQNTAERLARLGEVQSPALGWLRDRTVRMLGRVIGTERPARDAQQEDPAWLLATVRENHA